MSVKTPVGGGSPAWYDSVVLASTDGHIEFGPTAATEPLLAGKVTLPAGNVTKLRIGCKFGFATATCKIGLYDSSKAEIISTTVSLPATNDTITEVSITPTAISAGTYYIAVASDSNQQKVGTLSGQPSGDSLITYTYGYSDAPMASLSAWSSHTVVPAVGAEVTP